MFADMAWIDSSLQLPADTGDLPEVLAKRNSPTTTRSDQ